MACNLAVSITKAAVSDEGRLRLLTPEVVEETIAGVARERGLAVRLSAGVYNGRVYLSGRLGAFDLEYDGGRLRLSSASGRRDEALAEALAAAVSGVADVLLAGQIKGVATRRYGKKAVTSRSAVVDVGGTQQLATLIKIRV